MFLNVELPEDYRGRWETFVDHTLSETNRKNTIDLVNTQNYIYSTNFDNMHMVKRYALLMWFRLALETHVHLQRMIWRALSLKN